MNTTNSKTYLLVGLMGVILLFLLFSRSLTGVKFSIFLLLILLLWSDKIEGERIKKLYNSLASIVDSKEDSPKPSSLKVNFNFRIYPNLIKKIAEEANQDEEELKEELEKEGFVFNKELTRGESFTWFVDRISNLSLKFWNNKNKFVDDFGYEDSLFIDKELGGYTMESDYPEKYKGLNISYGPWGITRLSNLGPMGFEYKNKEKTTSFPFSRFVNFLYQLEKNGYSANSIIKKFPREIEKILKENNFEYEGELYQKYDIEPEEEIHKDYRNEWYNQGDFEIYSTKTEKHSFSNEYFTISISMDQFDLAPSVFDSEFFNK